MAGATPTACDTRSDDPEANGQSFCLSVFFLWLIKLRDGTFCSLACVINNPATVTVERCIQN